MKQLVEFTKISEEELPQIYCDMDQVLCDFIGGAEKVLGTSFDKAPKAANMDELLPLLKISPNIISPSSTSNSTLPSTI